MEQSNSNQRIIKHYAKMQAQTASNEKKITMLHEHLHELLILAQDVYGVDRRYYLDKAQNILSQFQACLQISDDLSQSLFYVYDYIFVRLEFGAKNDISDSLALVATLKNTFQELLLRR